MSNTPQYREVWEGRWRWWYDSILDWMMANPGATLAQCAAFHRKTPSTISAIINTDLFKARLAQRRAEYRAEQDYQLQAKLGQVAHTSLDLILTQMEKKKDGIPLAILRDTATSALDALGYGAKNSPVSVSINQDNRQDNRSVTVGLPALEEARQAMRQVEEARKRALPAPSPSQSVVEDVLDATILADS